MLNHLVTHTGKDFKRIGRNAALLVVNLIRQPLMVDTWRIYRLLRRHAVINHVERGLQGDGDDAGAARRAEYHKDFIVFGHQRRAHR
ncbi:hypothetical protein D3C72_1721970 [compost metagenome]